MYWKIVANPQNLRQKSFFMEKRIYRPVFYKPKFYVTSIQNGFLTISAYCTNHKNQIGFNLEIISNEKKLYWNFRKILKGATILLLTVARFDFDFISKLCDWVEFHMNSENSSEKSIFQKNITKKLNF